MLYLEISQVEAQCLSELSNIPGFYLFEFREPLGRTLQKLLETILQIFPDIWQAFGGSLRHVSTMLVMQLEVRLICVIGRRIVTWQRLGVLWHCS
jgi:hypothetical protein